MNCEWTAAILTSSLLKIAIQVLKMLATLCVMPYGWLHNTKMKTLVECGEYAIGTLKRYQVLLRHIENFIKITYQKADVDLKDLDQKFIDDFEFYLPSIKLNDINTSNKHLKNLKKIILICIHYKWTEGDPFDGRKLQSKPVNRTILTEDELRHIVEKELTTQRLEQVRDSSCLAAIRFSPMPPY